MQEWFHRHRKDVLQMNFNFNLWSHKHYKVRKQASRIPKESREVRQLYAVCWQKELMYYMVIPEERSCRSMMNFINTKIDFIMY